MLPLRKPQPTNSYLTDARSAAQAQAGRRFVFGEKRLEGETERGAG
jgi:hypothetical protein